MDEEIPTQRAEEAGVKRTSMQTDDERAVEFARAALARARSRARGYGRSAARAGRYISRAYSTENPTEPVYSGARPDERDPALLGSAVSALVGELGWSERINVAGVIGRWSAIVGEDIAAHTQVEAFDVSDNAGGSSSATGTLAQVVVRADSTAWATQLRLLSSTLCQRLAEDLGTGFTVQMRILGPSAPSWRHGSRHVPGRGPRDTYG